MDIAKAVKTGKVKPAYITDKEKKILLKRDKTKGAISEKFYKGIPVLFAGEGDPDDPSFGGEPGEGVVGDGLGHVGVGDTTSGEADPGADSDWGDIFGIPIGKAEGPKEGDLSGPGATPEGPIGDIDDKAEYMTEEECKAAGGRYDGAMCHFDGSPPPPEGDGDGDGDGEEDSDLLFERKPYEKAPPYSYKVPKVDPGAPPSETERVRAKTTAATPFAEAVRASMVGEVAGVADKERTIKDMDAKRKFDDAMLSQAQAFAASGMSFSTPMLNAEEEMVRDLARQRLVSADEAARMQEKLNMARWEASEPIMKLAAEAKLGDAGLGGTFTPGAYDVGKLSSVSGIGIPRFSGLPSTSLDKEEKPITDDKGETTGDDDKDTDTSPSSHFTDKKGDVCYFSETTVDDDGVRSCPGTTVGGEA
jgi:hypothetical protein